MANLLRWFTRGVLGLDGAAHAGDDKGHASFEQIDAARLGVSECRTSASMRFDDAPVLEFDETLPALTWNTGPVRSTVLPRPAARTRT